MSAEIDPKDYAQVITDVVNLIKSVNYSGVKAYYIDIADAIIEGHIQYRKKKNKRFNPESVAIRIFGIKHSLAKVIFTNEHLTESLFTQVRDVIAKFYRENAA